MTPQILENIVILCLKNRFSKQNSVIRLKSNIWPPQILGLATPLMSSSAIKIKYVHPRYLICAHYT